MLRVFGLAIFLSAALLFCVQPLAAKLMLPLLGGSPQVWNTCMVFFQAVLLVGYLYSHLLTKHLPLKGQAAVHIVVLGAAGAMLPIVLPEITDAPSGDVPVFWLIKFLAVMVGLPFFAVSTAGPLLQRWFSRTDDPHAKDPYFLYAASNAGSAVGLLSYPIIIEPRFTLGEQGFVWTVGYVLLVLTTLVAAVLMLKREAPAPAKSVSKPADAKPITWRRRLRWVLLAFVPSSLMLGVTHHITIDVAAIPLLWVIPLLLYLVSMIIAFSPRARISGRAYGAVLPWLALPVAAVILLSTKDPISLIIVLHLAFMFVVCLMCHRLIAEDRPDPSHLTEFYLLMAVGGVLGGIFNGLLAPIAFDRLLEYPIIIALALLVRPQAWDGLSRARLGLGVLAAAALVGVVLGIDLLLTRYPKTDATLAEVLRVLVPPALALALSFRSGGIRLAFAVLAIGVATLYTSRHGNVLHNERTFFGVHQVVALSGGNWHVLRHGTTNHGIQARFEPGKFLPTSYYHRTGPVPVVFGVAQARGPVSVSVLGLGTGTVASYGRDGDAFRFFEIDPAVGRIAMNPDYFSYLYDYRPAIEKIVIGDGRLLMEGEPESSSDIIMLDAFTSDAVPVHLMTREAFKNAYLPKLKPGGMILVNTSNRHLNFWPVLARIAEDLNLVAYACADKATPEQALEAKQWSKFVVLARNKEDLGGIATDPRWQQLVAKPGDPLWTDDFSNLLSVFSWR